MSETRELTGPLVRMYRQAGALAFRMQSGQVKVRGAWMHLCPAGTADVLVFPRNLPVTWVETKQAGASTAKERVQAQAEFAEQVRAMGHRYLKVRSIDEGMEALR